MMFRYLFLLIVGSLPAGVSLAQMTDSLHFGNGNTLLINKATGLYAIKYHGKEVIGAASAAYKLGAVEHRTAEYTHRSLRKQDFSTAWGKGTCYTLVSEAPGLPRMLQYFYGDTSKEYLVLELELQGDGLTSNYLAPLVSPAAIVPGGTALHSLQVPFDNDTFIRYASPLLDAKGTASTEVGVVYDDQNRHGLVLGSLNHTVWKSALKSRGAGAGINGLELFAGYSDVAVTRDSMPHGSLSGKRLVSPKMFVGYFNDWRDGVETYAKVGRLEEPPFVKSWDKATPVGWNSWGVMKEHLTYEKATGVADFFDKELPAFRNDDGTAYIDLDSFWDNMVKGGFSGDFSKLKDFVNYCKKRKLQPGVYWAPFTDWGFKGGADRKAEGGDYRFADMWTRTDKGFHDLDGGRALDPTHPGTQKRIAYVIGKLKAVGFKMIKIDFLSHAAIESAGFYDPSVKTGMQAYRAGMECLSNAIGNSMLVYAAISPSLATARYAHMRRIACDAWKTLKDAEYTVNSVTYGWWQTYLYNYIDADHLVFEKENETTNRVRLVSGLITGSVILGDDYSLQAPWQARIKEWLQQPALREFIRSGKAFRPIEGQSSAASRVFVRNENGRIYLAVFNFENTPLTLHLDAARLGLNPSVAYEGTDLLGSPSVSFTGGFDVPFSGGNAYLYQISKKQ